MWWLAHELHQDEFTPLGVAREVSCWPIGAFALHLDQSPIDQALSLEPIEDYGDVCPLFSTPTVFADFGRGKTVRTVDAAGHQIAQCLQHGVLVVTDRNPVNHGPLLGNDLLLGGLRSGRRLGLLGFVLNVAAARLLDLGPNGNDFRLGLLGCLLDLGLAGGKHREVVSVLVLRDHG